MMRRHYLLSLLAAATLQGATVTARAQQPLTTTPQGQALSDMEWRSQGMYPDYTTSQVTQFTTTDAIAHVVVDGSRIYIKDPISHYPAGVWIEGELSADGTTATFHTPQPYADSNGTLFYVTRMERSGQSLAKTAQTDLVFSYADGKLTQTDGGYLSITNLAGQTAGYVDYNIVIAPQTQQVQAPPAGATLSSYQMAYEGSGEPQSKAVSVAFVGTDVYIANPSGAEGSWLHGTLQGDQIVVPNGQYLGPDESMGYYTYLKAAEGKVEVISIPGFGDFPYSTIELVNAESIVFSYDAATRSFSTTQLFLVNAGSNSLGDNYYDFGNASFTPYDEQPATPADPVVVSNTGIIEGYGYGAFTIDMPNTDVDGNFINADNMYYNVYFDNYLLQAPNGLTDIPYNYTDGQYIRVSGITHTFFYTQPIEQRIGVQTFYKVGQEVHASQLVWYDVNATDDDPSGIATQPMLWGDDADASRQGALLGTFDLQGHRVNSSYRGLVIERRMLPGGTVTARKRLQQ